MPPKINGGLPNRKKTVRILLKPNSMALLDEMPARALNKSYKS